MCMYVYTYHVVENWWEKASANLTIRLFVRENIFQYLQIKHGYCIRSYIINLKEKI